MRLTPFLLMTSLILSSTYCSVLRTNENDKTLHREKRTLSSIFSLGFGLMNFLSGGSTVFGRLGKCYNVVMAQDEANVVIQFMSSLLQGSGPLFDMFGPSLNDRSRTRLTELAMGARRISEIFFTCFAEEISKMPRKPDVGDLFVTTNQPSRKLIETGTEVSTPSST